MEISKNASPTNHHVYTISGKILGFGKFDFIIVGGGTAGTLLANRLSQISTWKILLLEVGQPDDRFTLIPALNYNLRTSPRNWGYLTKPQSNSCLGISLNLFVTGKNLLFFFNLACCLCLSDIIRNVSQVHIFTVLQN